MSIKHQTHQDLNLLSGLRRRAEEEPTRIWASIPLDNNDVSKGFREISFRQFAIAVDYAMVWLNEVLDDAKNSIFAYQGFNDCAPPILAIAAARLGCRMLLPFPLAPPEVKRYLIEAADCKIVLYPSPFEPIIKQMFLGHENLNIKMIAVPNVMDWLNASEYPSVGGLSDSFEYPKDRPWMIFHSSGTTGKPKLVTYTQEMINANHAFTEGISTHTERKATLTLLRNTAMHLTIPSVHASGMFVMLPVTIFSGSRIILGPTDRPPSSETVKAALKHGGVKSLLAPPVWIRQLCNDPEGLALLKNLDFISFVGAPMDKPTGDSLCKHTQLAPAFGSTECGAYWTYVISESHDWEYFSFFDDAQGIEFEKLSENLYELIFKKSKEAVWQQIFLQKPDLDVYRTADLFKKHPTRSNLWLFAGRKDDMFKLSSGYKIFHSMNERLIEGSPLVKTAVVGGPGSPIAFLLVEPAVYPESQDAKESLLAGIWEVVEEVNRQDIDTVAIHRDMVVLADKTKPFSRSVKDSVLRRETFEIYASEIQERMVARGFSWELDQVDKK